MSVVKRDITIKKPASVVYALLTHPAERAKWQSSFEEEALPGPLAVGSRIKAKRRGSTSGSTYEFLVTGLVPDQRLAMDALRNGQRVAATTFGLDAHGDSTRVRSEAEVKLSGLQRMLAPLVTSELEKRMEAELAALKKHAETPA